MRGLAWSIVVVVSCAALQGSAEEFGRPAAANTTVCTISGTGAADQLDGTSAAEVICGGGGDDAIHGGGGDDVVFGGAGDDRVYGGGGSDRLLGGSGSDLVDGGVGADLNMTAALPILFSILWLYWSVTENGVKGFLAHIFAPKGEFKGFMKLVMGIIFFAVGLIEVFSILLRPVAFSFRLFGNIYAGENMLEIMMSLVPKQIAFLPALPFYFLELLVGLIQALVFMLLSSVFLKLMCEHHDEGHAEGGHSH